MIKSQLIFHFSLFSLGVFAQKEITHESQQWMNVKLSIPFNKSLALDTDGSLRWKDLSNLNHQLIRTQISYKIEEKIMIGSGISLIGNLDNGHLNTYELRPHQEITFYAKIEEKIKVQQRLRLEQRIYFNESRNFNHRFRYAIALERPMIHHQKTNQKLLSLGVGNEIFLQAGKEVIHDIFNQNRVSIYPIFHISPAIQVRCSYVWQYSSASSKPNQFKDTDMIWLNVVLNWKYKNINI